MRTGLHQIARKGEKRLHSILDNNTNPRRRPWIAMIIAAAVIAICAAAIPGSAQAATGDRQIPAVKVSGDLVCRADDHNICLSAKISRSTGNRVTTVDAARLPSSLLIRAGWIFVARDTVNSGNTSAPGWWMKQAEKLKMKIYLVHWAADSAQCLDVSNQEVELGPCGIDFWAIPSRPNEGPMFQLVVKHTGGAVPMPSALTMVTYPGGGVYAFTASSWPGAELDVAALPRNFVTRK